MICFASMHLFRFMFSIYFELSKILNGATVSLFINLLD